MSSVNEVESEVERLLLNDEEVNSLIATDDEFSHELYRALCTDWIAKDGVTYSCTRKSAASFVSALRSKGEDELYFYYLGGHGTVSERVERIMNRLGYSIQRVNPNG